MKIFLKLFQLLFGKPEIDMFASRVNTQLPRFDSWKPDPGADDIDAFSVCWGDKIFICFPSFQTCTESSAGQGQSIADSTAVGNTELVYNHSRDDNRHSINFQSSER
jgi:hypothetical protein